MLDARFVRDNPDVVRAALESRGAAWDLDGFLSLDESRRALIAKTESLQARRNEASKQVGQIMREARTEAAEALKAEVRSINAELEGLQAELGALDAQATEMLLTVPNIPDGSVPCARRSWPA